MHYLDLFRFCPVCGTRRLVENDFKSKRCEECGFVYYFNAAAAVACFVENEKGELLMCRRACNPAKGTLDIVGGFVDPEESSTCAMVREMKEETGLDIAEADLQFLFSLPNVYEYSGMTIHSCDSFFRVTIPADAELKAQDDVAELMWMRKEGIDTEEIGLKSIRMATEKYLQNHKNTK